MRSPSTKPILVLVLTLGLGIEGSAQTTPPVCTVGTTTSITGTVYAPNGTDPLPNVTVYIPTTTVDPFRPGVSCPLVGTPPSGSPLVGTITATDGTFELDNVPVGVDVPLVIVSGRWRRQFVVRAASITACGNNPLPPSFVVMPQNQSQGDIPKIAIATGAVDQVECVLRKVGISDTEFTDPSGLGRINLYTGSGGPGAVIDSVTPNQSVLMGNRTTLDSYDLLMLPCQGTPNKNVDAGILGTQELANFINFANSGGRIYTSHFSYVWMNTNPPFDGVANWHVGQGSPPDGVATVDTSFSAGATLSDWLQDVGASVSPGQMSINTLRKDTDGVIPPTQSWLTLNEPALENPVMQFVFDTPIAPPGSTINQCGRVLFNEYHVEGGTSSPSKFFPDECSTGPMTPQEKLLEYMLFELTDEGGQPSLAPLIQDFGSEAVTYTTAPVAFTWTNNSSFTAQVKKATATGDFSVLPLSSDCSSVAGGASCTIQVVFAPSALGTRSGTLTVVSGENSLTAALTGTGTPGYTISATSLTYGNLDVGATLTQKITVTNIAPGPLPVPPFVTAGEYTVNTAPCGSSIAILSSCQINVTFDPTTTGPQSGTLSVASTSLLDSGLTASLSGNGVDFALSLNPPAGSVVAGDSVSSTLTLTPIAGYDAALTLSCNVGGAVASTCGLGTVSVALSETVSQTITLNTTSQYTVIGFSGWGRRGYLWLIALGSGGMLWWRRRNVSSLLRAGLLVAVLAAVGLSISGCSGKLPAQNPAYTGAGNYVVTVTATDGFLVHSATYSLTVTH
jgi:hypothetical protein